MLFIRNYLSNDTNIKKAAAIRRSFFDFLLLTFYFFRYLSNQAQYRSKRSLMKEGWVKLWYWFG